jgi:two-component system repressor protein LuxO
MTRSVLLVEDTASIAQVYLEYLRQDGWDGMVVESLAAARATLADKLFAAILLDVQLPDGSGLDLLAELKSAATHMAVVVITAHGSLSAAVDAMKAGADDYLVKPFAANRLLTTLRNAVERRRLTKIVSTLGDTIDGDRFEGFVGASLAMKAVYRVIDQAARSRATVFVTGESGTGKEVCAEAIHRRSPRAAAPFVAVNCAAIPRELMESEIFGHTKGAFTGAATEREGAASRADGGTLFLDEICEMDLPLQAKLLRFLQSGQVQKVGSDVARKVDVRIVCATNRDPHQEVESIRLREDLFYRLYVIPVHLPPLRERDDDAVAIARHLLATVSTEEGRNFRALSADAEELIRRTPWPGNVRQLQNAIRNAVVVNDGEVLTATMLPVRSFGTLPLAGATVPVSDAAARRHETARTETIRPLWRVERDAIEAAIQLCGGNVPLAAAKLGINPSTIYRKRQSWEDDPERAAD